VPVIDIPKQYDSGALPGVCVSSGRRDLIELQCITVSQSLFSISVISKFIFFLEMIELCNVSSVPLQIKRDLILPFSRDVWRKLKRLEIFQKLSFLLLIPAFISLAIIFFGEHVSPVIALAALVGFGVPISLTIHRYSHMPRARKLKDSGEPDSIWIPNEAAARELKMFFSYQG